MRDEVKVVRDGKDEQEHALENRAASLATLTLDDFGGRSDALGG
jgi:hypothetical protein